MAIPVGVILIWTGTNASIPTGWTRETSLDGLFPKGSADGINPNTTGGASTHTHSAVNHSHTTSGHTHTHVTTAGGNAFDDNSNVGSGGFRSTHIHTTNVNGISGGGLQTVGASYGAVSNNPPYVDVIYIKPTVKSLIPAGGVVFTTSNIPIGFQHCDGTNGTLDLRNKYLRGALTGQNAGGVGGSVTNVHSIAHTHSESAHSHSATSATGTSSAYSAIGGAGGNIPSSHTHTINLSSSTPGGVTDGGSLTTPETVEPAFCKLLPIHNTSGVNKPTSLNMVALWLGSLATIPRGWEVLSTMKSKYLKGANAIEEINSTGGSNTHTHASQNHSHTGASHTHTDNAPFENPRTVAGNTGSGAGNISREGSHAVGSTIGSTTTSWNNASTSGDSQNNEPLYRTVAYIQLNKLDLGGAALYNIL